MGDALDAAVRGLSRGVVLGGAGLMLACSGGDAESVGVASDAVICGTNDLQNVEQYVPVDGVSRAFVDEHERSVATGLADSTGGHSGGVLLGDGLLLTDSINTAISSVLFDSQLTPSGSPRTPEQFYRGSIINIDNLPGQKLFRLGCYPENEFGMAAIGMTPPSVNESVVAFTYGTLADGFRNKQVDVGQLSANNGVTLTYRNMDTLPGNAGSPVFSASTGRLVGLQQTEGDSSTCAVNGSGTAHAMTDIAAKSTAIKSELGSLQFLVNYDTDEYPTHSIKSVIPNIPSTWHHLLAGRFRNDSAKDGLFVYDSFAGVATVYAFTSPQSMGKWSSSFNLGKGWTVMTAGDFTGDGVADVLMYDPKQQIIALLQNDGRAVFTEAWRETMPGPMRWAQIFAGNFDPAQPGLELYFYSNYRSPNGQGPWLVEYVLRPSATPRLVRGRETSLNSVVEWFFVMNDSNNPSLRRAALVPYDMPFDPTSVPSLGWNGQPSPVRFTAPPLVTQIVTPPVTVDSAPKLFVSIADYNRFGVQGPYAWLYTQVGDSMSMRPGLGWGMSRLVLGNFLDDSPGSEMLAYDRFRTLDPTCAGGVKNGKACCPASCGVCDATPQCVTRPGGLACCAKDVVQANVPCTASGAPCVTTDPGCLTGIPRSGTGVCCAASCGHCGGPNCASLPGGSAACCVGTIQDSNVFCSGSMPPCKML